MGLADPIREALRQVEPRVRAAFVYGSVARQDDAASSDIDIMLISDTLTYGDVYSALEEAAEQLARPINPTILSTEELSKRIASDNAFVSRVLSQPKIWLIGGENDLRI